MISLYVILTLLLTHWFADFVCQSDWMAQNKSKSNFPLIVHVYVYGFILFIPSLWLFPFIDMVITFVILNIFLHFSTDFFTSRITSYLWKEKQVHWFFTTIGFDQFLHYCALFGTYTYLQRSI